MLRKLGIEAVDQSVVIDLCKQLLADNPKIIADVKSGNLKAAGSLIGQAKKRNHNVNPNDVRDLCLKMIEQM